MVVFLCWNGLNLVDSLERRLPEIHETYDKGDFKQTIDFYEGLISEGFQNAYVYYNLGNSYYRSGQRGDAIAAYLAAKRLRPRDQNIEENLRFALRKNEDNLSLTRTSGILNKLLFWTDYLSRRELVMLSLALWLFGFLLLAAAIVDPKQKTYLIGGALAAAFGLGLATIFFTTDSVDQPCGAITAPTALVGVRSGPGIHNQVQFELHDGAPFCPLQLTHSWVKIELSDGKTGWVEKENTAIYHL